MIDRIFRSPQRRSFPLAVRRASRRPLPLLLSASCWLALAATSGCQASDDGAVNAFAVPGTEGAQNDGAESAQNDGAESAQNDGAEGAPNDAAEGAGDDGAQAAPGDDVGVPGDGAEGAPSDGETAGEIDLEAATEDEPTVDDEPVVDDPVDEPTVDEPTGDEPVVDEEPSGDDEPVEPPPAGLLGPAARPQLNPAQAATMSVREFLARFGSLESGLTRDDWDPTADLVDLSGVTPDFRVGPGGTHASVQAAVDAAVAGGGGDRRFIQVATGTYREVVCVPSGAPPITLYGAGGAPEDTVIVFDNYSSKPKQPGTPANPCNPSLTSATHGTSGSATFAAYAAAFHARNLSIVNDTDETQAQGGVQAVALLTQGDRLVFERVRFVGNQDTLYVKTPGSTTVARAYFTDCYVEGDTDFVFGRGTFVLDGCTIHSVTTRTAGGVVLAPSTEARNPHGILVIDSTFTADGGAANGSISLGRAWDESQGDVARYAENVATGAYPNGQALVMRSVLGRHVSSVAPWRPAATTARPFSSTDGQLPANRLYEFENTGPGAFTP